ncbi:alpha amylase catalytic region [Bacteroides coprosuis DSM 18011]|uniref:Alpha amylase catalytic region n=1 Tax=Bacteroides coprosuis DSM 18011 TaxID=679937 RepID=F3ZTT8_9BACE|nr:alpha-amylase family glycosyl hydrolase [Bacteroides coprosuis]EGJ72322.1 alpha amylase catalytic region [Bacteroides coprosuis DSM 18011]
MKKRYLLGFLITVIFVLPSFGKQKQKFKPIPSWVSTSTFYQIYPQSFQDTDGDGIGDIQGIIDRLDYLKWLGIDALWLNPCFESEFKDAGYDVTDYYKVASRYGTNADIQRLFAEAKKRNMRVCLDLVAGHTSDKHPWFLESKKNSKNEFSDRYIWTNDSTLRPEPKFVSGNYERNGSYRKNFFDCQPALNFGYANPDKNKEWEQSTSAVGPQATRKELMNIIDYWMEMGADGFRVDMAHSLIKNDTDFAETNKLWHEIRTHFQDKFPEGVLIAEWGNPAKSVKAGFMFDFIIHIGSSAYSSMFFNNIGTYTRDVCYFSLEGTGTPTKFKNYYIEQLEEIGDDGFTCYPTANHDFQRPNSGNRNTVEQLKVAMTFFLTLPSIPLIYYGDEIGMKYIPGLPDKEGSMLKKGNRAGTRTPMQWDSSVKAGFSTATLDDFYLPLDPDEFRPNVEDQKNNPTSLLNFTRNLLHFRKTTDAFSLNNNIEFLYAEENSYPLVYKRFNQKEEYCVVLNPSGKRQTTFVAGNYKKVTPILVERCRIEVGVRGLNISSDGVSYGIFKIEKE